MSAHAKGSGCPSASISISVGTVQLDRVPGEMLAVADWEPSLHRSSHTYTAGLTMEYFADLPHRHGNVSGLKAAFEPVDTEKCPFFKPLSSQRS